MAWSGKFDDFNNSSDLPSHHLKSRSKQTPLALTQTHGRGQGSNYPPAQSGAGNRTTIASLQPGITSDKLVAVIIGKGEPRAVPNKKDPSNERHVLTMTIRDTHSDFINVSCWGSNGHIKELASEFHILDVVEITNAIVQSKPQDGSDERYRPWTPSGYQLTVGENRSSIKLYIGWDLNAYSQLTHIPVKASKDFYTLADINANGNNIHGQYISILACVKYVGQARDIVTKANKKIKRCEVKVFDETEESFPIVLWDEELINMAQTWVPRENVIFMADVRVTYDDFRKFMIGTATSKTIFTVNPDTQEAHSLYMYGQMADTGEEQEVANFKFDTNVDLSTISDVYTVEQILQLQATRGGSPVTTGIMYGHLTTFDIDADHAGIVVIRCGKCKKRLDADTGCCVNIDCPLGSATNLDGITEEDINRYYNIQLSVSDHTGTVANCALIADAAQKLIGCTVDKFLCCSSEQKTEIKWRYLLEVCKFYFKMVQLSKGPILKILSCEKADLSDVVKFL